MYFVKDQGIIAARAELAAMLAFVGTKENLDGIGITIDGGRLLAQASNGSAAVYNHGDALDGKGGPYEGKHEFQIPGDAVKMIRKSMDGKDEVLFTLNKAGRLTTAKIRDIESASVRGEFSLAGMVSEQLAIEMAKSIPSRPSKVSKPVGEIAIAPSLFALMTRVATAAGTNVCRITLPKGELDPVYCEIDEAGSLCDSERPRWVVVAMPVNLHAKAEEEAEEQQDAE